MKLCITATGNTLEALTDASFGRAPWLLLVDTDTLALEAIENSGVNASQGAGIAAAQMISNRGANGLLTGRVGPKAEAALQASGIPIFEGLARSSVREAVSQFNNGAYGNTGTNAPGTGPGAGAQSGQVGCRLQGGSGRGRGMGMGRGGGGGGRCQGGQQDGQGRKQRGGM